MKKLIISLAFLLCLCLCSCEVIDVDQTENDVQTNVAESEKYTEAQDETYAETDAESNDATVEDGTTILEYNGPDIVSLEYKSIDYDGGFESYKLLDLSNGAAYKKSFNPHYGQEADYKLWFNFDNSENDAFMNHLYTAGLLDFEDMYTTDDIIFDGGEWLFTIKFADGTEKISRGINASPDKLKAKIGEVIFDFTGNDFLEVLPESYTKPPVLEIGISYKIENHYYSNSLVGFAPYRYTWRSATYQADSYKAAILKSEHENVTYTVNISIAKMTGNSGNIQGVKLYSYTDDINNKTEISCDHSKQSIRLTAEENTNYILVIQYRYGEAEYWFTTVK